MIQIVARGAARIIRRNTLDDIWCIFKINIPRNANLHLRNVINDLLFLFLFLSLNSHLNRLDLTLTLTRTASKGIKKDLKTTSLLNLSFEVRSKCRNFCLALGTRNLVGSSLAGCVIGPDELFFIFHTISIDSLEGTRKLVLRTLVDFFRLDLPRWRSKRLTPLDIFELNEPFLIFHAIIVHALRGTCKLKVRR